MDLAQAEALAAMISARSEKAWRIGLAQLKGALGDKIGELRSLIVEALARLEASIDFSEDVSEQEIPDILPRIEEALAGADHLLSTYRQGELFTRGGARCHHRQTQCRQIQSPQRPDRQKKIHRHGNSGHHPGSDYGKPLYSTACAFT